MEISSGDTPISWNKSEQRWAISVWSVEFRTFCHFVVRFLSCPREANCSICSNVVVGIGSSSSLYISRNLCSGLARTSSYFTNIIRPGNSRSSCSRDRMSAVTWLQYSVASGTNRDPDLLLRIREYSPRTLGPNLWRERVTARGSRTRWIIRRVGSARSSGPIESIVARTTLVARNRRSAIAFRSISVQCASTRSRNDRKHAWYWLNIRTVLGVRPSANTFVSFVNIRRHCSIRVGGLAPNLPPQ